MYLYVYLISSKTNTMSNTNTIQYKYLLFLTFNTYVIIFQTIGFRKKKIKIIIYGFIGISLCQDLILRI